ncbi:hypothetical protein WMF38_51305 [Sorangium sp. So ce118]
MAVVAPAEIDAASRIASLLGQGAARLEAPDDVRALSACLREAMADPMIVSGLDRLSDAAWQQLDRLRGRITRDRLTLLVLSPQSAERLSRNAPNLASLFGAFFRWEDTSDAPSEPAAGDADQAEFDRLARAWMEDTQVESSLTRIIRHPAYQQIIAMGERAIRPILRDLEREPRMWGPALHAITGALPVPAADAGKVARVAEAWLAWAKDKGYAW